MVALYALQEAAPVSANGSSESLTAAPGLNVVSIESGSVATGATATLMTRIGGSGQWSTHLDPDDPTKNARLDDTDSNGAGGFASTFVVLGPCEVKVLVAGYSTSTPITLKVMPSERR